MKNSFKLNGTKKALDAFYDQINFELQGRTEEFSHQVNMINNLLKGDINPKDFNEVILPRLKEKCQEDDSNFFSINENAIDEYFEKNERLIWSSFLENVVRLTDSRNEFPSVNNINYRDLISLLYTTRPETETTKKTLNNLYNICVYGNEGVVPTSTVFELSPINKFESDFIETIKYLNNGEIMEAKAGIEYLKENMKQSSAESWRNNILDYTGYRVFQKLTADTFYDRDREEHKILCDLIRECRAIVQSYKSGANKNIFRFDSKSGISREDAEGLCSKYFQTETATMWGAFKIIDDKLKSFCDKEIGNLHSKISSLKKDIGAEIENAKKIKEENQTFKKEYAVLLDVLAESANRIKITHVKDYECLSDLVKNQTSDLKASFKYEIEKFKQDSKLNAVLNNLFSDSALDTILDEDFLNLMLDSLKMDILQKTTKTMRIGPCDIPVEYTTYNDIERIEVQINDRIAKMVTDKIYSYTKSELAKKLAEVDNVNPGIVSEKINLDLRVDRSKFVLKTVSSIVSIAKMTEKISGLLDFFKKEYPDMQFYERLKQFEDSEFRESVLEVIKDSSEDSCKALDKMESSGFLGFCSKKTNEKNKLIHLAKQLKTIAKEKMLDHTKIIDKIIKDNVKEKNTEIQRQIKEVLREETRNHLQSFG